MNVQSAKPIHFGEGSPLLASANVSQTVAVEPKLSVAMRTLNLEKVTAEMEKLFAKLCGGDSPAVTCLATQPPTFFVQCTHASSEYDILELVDQLAEHGHPATALSLLAEAASSPSFEVSQRVTFLTRAIKLRDRIESQDASTGMQLAVQANALMMYGLLSKASTALAPLLAGLDRKEVAMAAALSSETLVAQLVQKIDQRLSRGEEPGVPLYDLLETALKNGHDGAAEMILAKMNEVASDRQGHGYRYLLQRLPPAAKELPSRRTLSALLQAIRAGNVGPMRELIGMLGGKLAAPLDGEGATIFHLAAQENISVEALEILFDAAADKNVPDFFGRTPLHYAANRNQLGAVNVLLAKGADVHKKNDLSHSPLLWARQAGAVEVVDRLIKEGADRPLTKDQEPPGVSRDGIKEPQDPKCLIQ